MGKKKNLTTIISENRFIHTIFCVILGFLVGAIFLVVMGLDVGAAYGRLLKSLSNVKNISYVIVYSIPYIVTGLPWPSPSKPVFSTSALRVSLWWAPWPPPLWASSSATCPR